MDRFEAARALGLADTELLHVVEVTDGTAVRVKDGSQRLITDDGVYALTDHPATANFRRWDGSHAAADALAEAAQPEPEPATDEEGDDTPERMQRAAAAAAEQGERSEVPDGNADAVLDWVGDDTGRAAQALAAEEKRDNPRSTLISKLRKVSESS